MADIRTSMWDPEKVGMPRYNRVWLYLYELQDKDFVDLWNDYVERAYNLGVTSESSRHIYPLEYAYQLVGVDRFIRSVRSGYISEHDKWCFLGGDGLLYSDSRLSELVDIDELAHYIDDHEEDLGDNFLAAILRYVHMDGSVLITTLLGEAALRIRTERDDRDTRDPFDWDDDLTDEDLFI